MVAESQLVRLERAIAKVLVPRPDLATALRLDAAIAVRIGGFEGERNRTAVLVVVALLLAGYLFRAFFLVTRGGLREVGAHIDAMARGDLTRSPQPWGRDQAALPMTTLATTQDALRRLVTEVRTGADAIVGASTQISAGALDLSGRTEQTAAALEESAASMEQISSTVHGTADHARQGAEIAKGNAEQLESLSTAIADAASQQDGGVSQVGQAIQDLDRGAQQNAALVEQTAAAAGQPKDQATALVGTVAVFRLPQAVH